MTLDQTTLDQTTLDQMTLDQTTLDETGLYRKFFNTVEQEIRSNFSLKRS
jgi:hypothetical protein